MPLPTPMKPTLASSLTNCANGVELQFNAYPTQSWLSGIFGGKSVSLECITGQSERSRAHFGHFQASFEDLLLHVILDVSHVQRIRDIFGNALYKCSFYLLYFTYMVILEVSSHLTDTDKQNSTRK